MNKKALAKSALFVFSIIFILGFAIYALWASAIIDTLDSTIPIDTLNTTDNTPSFTFTVTGNSSTYNCTLYVNSTSKDNNATTDNNSATVLTSIVLTDGIYVWYINCTDADAIVNQTTPKTITIDSTAPTITVYSPINNSYLNYDVNITVNFSATDVSGINNYWYYNETDNVSYTAEQLITVTESTHTFVFYANDTLGQVASKIIIFTTDLTNPTATINAPAENAVKTSKTLSINVTATDTNRNYTLVEVINSTGAVINSTTNTSAEFVVALGVPVDGTYSVNATVYDLAGRTFETNNSGIVVDSTSPTTTYVSASTLAAGNHSLNYIYVNVTATDSGQGLDTISIRLYNATALLFTNTSTSSPHFINYTGLADGLYSFNATANDTAGNSVNVATRVVRLDTAAPTTTDDAPSGWQTANFNITLSPTDSGSGIAYTTYGVDGTLANGTTIVINTQGNHTITYYSVDNAGNVETTVNDYAALDSGVSSVILYAPAANYLTNSSSVIINFTASDSVDSNLSCKIYINSTLNSTVNVINMTAYTLTQSYVNNNSWYVNCSDDAGNYNSSVARTFQIDTSAPTLSPVSIISNNVNTSLAKIGNIVNLSFTSNEIINTPIVTISTQSATVGGSGVSWWATYTMTSAESEGNIAFNIAFSDIAGNAGTAVTAVTDSSVVLFDRTNSSTTNNAPSGWQSSDFSVTLTPTDGGSGVNYTNYSLDGGAATTGVSIAISTDGNHSIVYYSVDKAGNVEPSTTVYAALDKTKPSVSSSGPVNNLYNSSAAVDFTFTSTDVLSSTTSCTIYVNGAANKTGSASNGSAYIAESFTAATYTWYVNCSDLAGNFNFSSTRNFTIDLTNPIVDVTPATNSMQNNRTFSVHVNVTETNLNFTNVTVYNSSWAYINSTTDSTANFFVNLGVPSDGAYNINVTTRDLSGRSGTDASTNLTVDTTAPTTTASAVKSDGSSYTFATTTSSSYVNVTLSCSDGSGVGCGSTLYCNDTANSCSPYAVYSAVFQISDQGTTYIRYLSNDSFGATESVKNKTISIDSSAPTANASIISNNANTSLAKVGDKVNITIISNESVSAPSVIIAGHVATVVGSGVTWNANYTLISSDTPGNVTFVVNVSDSENNTVTVTSTIDGTFVLFDKTAPSTANNSPTGWQSTAYNVTLTPTDGGSGVATTIYSLDGANATAGTVIGISTAANHSIVYYSVDNAGNVESNTTVYAALDLTDPSVTLNAPIADSTQTTRTVTINVSVTETNFNYTSVVIYNSSGSSVNSTTNTSSNFVKSLNVPIDGVYSVNVTSYDLAARSGTTFASNITIDATAPSLTINYPLQDTQYNDTDGSMMRINLSASDATIGLGACWYNLNGTMNMSNATTTCNSSGYTYFWIYLVNGTYTLNMYANDSLNNFASDSVDFTVLDDAAPNISIRSISTLPKGTSSTILNVTTDENATCRYGTNSSATFDSMTLNMTNLIASHNATLATGNGGSYTYYVRCQDMTGNKNNASSSVSFSQSSASSGGGSSGGGSSGGGGFTSDPESKVSYEVLSSGPTKVAITNGDIPLSSLTVTTSLTHANVTFVMSKPSAPSDKHAGKVYGYIQVEHKNLEDSEIKSALIDFSVSKTWLTTNNVSKFNVSLSRFSAGKWTELDTKIVSEDTLYVYYQAASPGLSLFAINEKIKTTTGPIAAPKTNVTKNNTANLTSVTGQVAASAPADVNTEPIADDSALADKTIIASGKNSWIATVAVLLIIGLIVFMYIYSRKGRPPKNESREIDIGTRQFSSQIKIGKK